jgi:hypothetical protein
MISKYFSLERFLLLDAILLDLELHDLHFAVARLNYEG